MPYKVDFSEGKVPKIALAEDAKAVSFMAAKRELVAYCEAEAQRWFERAEWARRLRKIDVK